MRAPIRYSAVLQPCILPSFSPPCAPSGVQLAEYCRDRNQMTLQRPLLAGYAGACASEDLPTSDVITTSVYSDTCVYIQIHTNTDYMCMTYRCIQSRYIHIHADMQSYRSVQGVGHAIARGFPQLCLHDAHACSLWVAIRSRSLPLHPLVRCFSHLA